jgi:hypothetical protein
MGPVLELDEFLVDDGAATVWGVEVKRGSARGQVLRPVSPTAGGGGGGNSRRD